VEETAHIGSVRAWEACHQVYESTKVERLTRWSQDGFQTAPLGVTISAHCLLYNTCRQISAVALLVCQLGEHIRSVIVLGSGRMWPPSHPASPYLHVLFGQMNRCGRAGWNRWKRYSHQAKRKRVAARKPSPSRATRYNRIPDQEESFSLQPTQYIIKHHNVCQLLTSLHRDPQDYHPS
jgi:hypothetical protein